MGSEEREAGEVAVKPLRSAAEQIRLPIENLAQSLKQRLEQELGE
jgi:hypothetical protein